MSATPSTDNEPLFYASGDHVYQRPHQRQMGFRLCTTGDEAHAAEIARCLNADDANQQIVAALANVTRILRAVAYTQQLGSTQMQRLQEAEALLAARKEISHG